MFLFQTLRTIILLCSMYEKSILQTYETQLILIFM